MRRTNRSRLKNKRRKRKRSFLQLDAIQTRISIDSSRSYKSQAHGRTDWKARETNDPHYPKRYLSRSNDSFDKWRETNAAN